MSAIDPDFVKFVAEVTFQSLPLEGLPVNHDIVFPLQHNAGQEEVLLIEQVSLPEKLDNFGGVYIIVALLYVHGDEVQLRLSHLSPSLHEDFIFFHDIVIIEHGEPKILLEHLCFQIFEHHVRYP